MEISKLKRLKSTKTSPRIIQEADELLKKIDIQITEKREALNFYKDNAREISGSEPTDREWTDRDFSKGTDREGTDRQGTDRDPGA